VNKDDKDDKVLPNGNDLYATLWENVQKIKAGELSAANANAMSNAIGKMFTAVKIQMEFAKMTGKAPNLPPFLT
jgi:hypothetical protein